MKRYTTSQAAAKLGVSLRTLQRWVDEGRITPPPLQHFGTVKFRAWTERDIERVRKQRKGD